MEDMVRIHTMEHVVYVHVFILEVTMGKFKCC